MGQYRIRDRGDPAMRFADWLALREPADDAARSRELVARLPAAGSHVIHDLGCGTGSMARWLGPLLRGEQHWVLHDRDAGLLRIAAASFPAAETRQSDITLLGPSDLAGATLITASALLDMLTSDELTRLVTACAGVGCPTLLTLSVVGEVELAPAHPLDQRVQAAFNDHQRRRGLLGPDAVGAAVNRFSRVGAEVIVRPSPWQLDRYDVKLTTEWFSGWVAAACEQDTELAAQTGGYARQRLEQASAGQLSVTVGHADLLALPPSSS
jgi:hypothetical protein